MQNIRYEATRYYSKLSRYDVTHKVYNEKIDGEFRDSYDFKCTLTYGIYLF